MLFYFWAFRERINLPSTLTENKDFQARKIWLEYDFELLIICDIKDSAQLQLVHKFSTMHELKL